MTRRPSKARPIVDFDGLRGLRTRSYIRESSLRQVKADHYGPDTQRAGIRRFCERWQLAYPDREYFDASSGRGTAKRNFLHSALAEADEYDVLLVYITSRSFRNREDAQSWKRKFREAGITIVFTEQGIISGLPRDKLLEGFHEIIDEQYSDTQAMLISGGLRQKFEKGGVNGVQSLGYRRFHGEEGDPLNGSLIVDEAKRPAVRAVVDRYLTRRYSAAAIALDINLQVDEHGCPLYTTRLGRPFTKGSVEEILRNRTYTGVTVWRPGTPEEEVRPGTHEVLITIEEWAEIERIRARRTTVRGRRPVSRSYPLSRPSRCFYCRASFAGDTGGRLGSRRLRHAISVLCDNPRRSFAVDPLEAQMTALLTERMRLPDDWQQVYLKAVGSPAPAGKRCSAERGRLERALEKLKDLYTWQDMTREEYHRQKDEIDHQLAAIASPSSGPVALVDVRRAAELLLDPGALWSHPGVSGKRREEFIDEVFEEILLDENGIRRVTTRDEYRVLVAVAEGEPWGGNGRGDRI